MLFDLACDLLGHDIVTAFTGCRRIKYVEDGIFVAEDGSRWRFIGDNEIPPIKIHYFHGNRICDHP